MSKFLHRHNEGWQCAQDTIFNRLVSDIQANKVEYKKKIKVNNGDHNQETLSEEKFKQYENAIIRDELTGLYNTHFFSQKIGKELKRAKRYKRPFSLMVVSLDRVSQLQKLYGNLLACQILQKEAEILNSCTRDSDLPFRIGTEQFAIIFPETCASIATTVGQRLCEQTRATSIANGANNVIVTVSVGIASFPTHGRQEKELLSIALQFLHEAQRSGGNRVCTT